MILQVLSAFRIFIRYRHCANIQSFLFSSESSSNRAVAPECGRALPGLYAERTDYRLSTIATTRCETVEEKLRFGRTTSRGIAPYQNGLAQSAR